MSTKGELVVVGCGAIGLPLAVAFASKGRSVVGYDIDVGRVAALNGGRQSLLDEGLDEALSQTLVDGRIRFVAHLEPSPEPRTFVVAVPTPGSAEAGFDARPLDAAAAAIADVALDGDLICIRSTAPIGTARRLAGHNPRLRFAACPDRSLSGRAYVEQFSAPHIVGGTDAVSAEAAAAVFAVLGPVVPVHNAETAEAIKLFGNVQRDVIFALANQFALVCEAAGIDFSEVRSAGQEGYPRFALARPGPVGGPCLTKDTHLLASSPVLAGQDLDLLRAARRLNESLPIHVAGQILTQLKATPGAVAILGLSFKGQPATRDRRGAAAEALAAALREADAGLELRLWDPSDPAPLEPVLDGASVVVLANDDPALIACAERASGAVLFDLTGILPRPVPARRFGDGLADEARGSAQAIIDGLAQPVVGDRRDGDGGGCGAVGAA